MHEGLHDPRPVREGLDDKGVLNVAVVGLGYWGPNLLRALVEMGGVEVTQVCDRDGERLERVACRYPAITPTTSVDDVLEDPEVEAVLIATPVFTHFDLGARSLRAGKHTFV